MSGELTALSAEINDHHRKAYGHAAQAIEHARQAGELLLQAKAQVAHGQWLPWLEAHCEVGEREAQRYMRLARKWDTLKSDTVTDLSLKGAMARLTEQRDPDDVGGADRDIAGDNYPELVPGHSAVCRIKVNDFLIYIISESAKHPGYWHLGDMVHNTVTVWPCKPEGIREALRQDNRINTDHGIVRWNLLPVEHLFDGAAA